MDYARGLASFFKATIHVLHVIPDQTWPIEGTGMAVPDLIGTWEKEAQAHLESLKSQDVATEVHTVRGQPFAQIVQYAKEHEIELIVMGTHGRGAVQHMLLGSVAEKVVRAASCPVLTVRHPDAAIEAV